MVAVRDGTAEKTTGFLELCRRAGNADIRALHRGLDLDIKDENVHVG